MGKSLEKNTFIISKLLQNWYEVNKRDLPWRNTHDPYIIWISEIILQQTRVDQGYSYFMRFIERFPDIDSLSRADEDEVLKLWQGLGYYSRARNLHTAAKDIMTRFDGVFPQKYEDVLSLKGIGEYTAAAITSFAYNDSYAVLDGNVFRVLSRLFAVKEPIDTTKGKKLFGEMAQEILDRENPGLHNQAMMELGALQCTPANPACIKCPLSGCCFAYAAHEVALYPVKQGKINVKNRYFNYLDIQNNSYTYLNKRTGDDIWKNLYEFPLIETEDAITLEKLLSNDKFNKLFSDTKIGVKHVFQTKHVLSHRNIFANFYQVEVLGENLENEDFIKIKKEDIDDYPVSRLVHRYIEKFYEGKE